MRVCPPFPPIVSTLFVFIGGGVLSEEDARDDLEHQAAEDDEGEDALKNTLLAY